VDVGAGDEPETQQVTVRNVGTDVLTVFGPELDLGTDFFAPLSIVETLDPGESVPYGVTFDPRTALAHEDVLTIASSDPETPIVRVPLHGVGMAPVLEVDPPRLDVVAHVGCDVSRTFVLRNTGNDVLILRWASFASTSEELALEAGEYPLELGPDDFVTLDVSYRPLDEGADAGVLILSSSDPLSPDTIVAVTADAWLAGTRTDSFSQDATPSDEFPLGQDPMEASIVVEIDGSVVGGWAYTGHAADGGTNAVRFDVDSVPPPGATVDATYVVAGTCD
jgi:hypothetical protein